MSQAPLLVLAVGNPSRGDDAVGPLVLDALAARLGDDPRVELLGDFQLQIEHALDLVGRARVLFVDASVTAGWPFTWAPVHPARDASHSTHALSPAAVLDACQRLGEAPPPAEVVGIAAERFELGEAPSARAVEAAARAVEAIVAWVDAGGGPGAAAGAGPGAARFVVRGVVQGVGFRPWVARTARALGLRGAVANRGDAVEITASGPVAAIDALAAALPEAPGEVTAVSRAGWDGDPGPDPFAIADSRAGDADTLPIPADRATCPACAAEVADPADRHHRYPFTSCPACGPRYAILTGLPFDRASTTLAGFPPCPACAAEVDDPADRRFHAQTAACPACGPRAWLARPDGSLLPADPIAGAAAVLAAGGLVAIRGIGAFHLAADATDPAAVARLRAVKRRDARPLAVMVPDLAAADAVAVLDDAARAALVSAARPIVVVPARPGATLDVVRGPSRRIGLLLPYTPLHDLLLAAVGRPLVMTSANLSGLPAPTEAAEVIAALGPRLAPTDALLLHDRPIARRVEDSVVAPVAGRIRPWRRARGLAPRLIRLPAASPAPVLATGGHLKNTACVVVGDHAWLTPHLGDLDTVEAEAAWAAEVDGLLALLGVRPALVVHDRHPDYATTALAGRWGAPTLAIQHHHAHVLAAAAEGGRIGPVLGITLDGAGHGDDGALWGGELLRVDGLGCRRAATLRPLPLVGGEAAIREVWRLALAALVDVDADAGAPSFPCFDGAPVEAVRRILRPPAARPLAGGPLAHGAGRWLDAFGALVLGVGRAAFEGEVPLRLEEAADPDAPPWPWALHPGEPAVIDLRPALRALLAERDAGAPVAALAGRVHATLIDAVTGAARAVGGGRPVVLAGGCLQNGLLAAGLQRRLDAWIPAEVPVGDGGIALGQAWAGVLHLRG